MASYESERVLELAIKLKENHQSKEQSEVILNEPPGIVGRWFNQTDRR